MEYVVKNEQNELVRLIVVSGLPMLPEGFELIGVESEVNPNGLDLPISKVEIQTIVPEQQVLVQEEILAKDEVPYQAEILAIEAVPEKWTKEGEADVFVDPLDATWTHVPAIPAVEYQPEIPYQEAVAHVPAIYNTIPAVMGPRVVADIVKSATKTKTAQIQAAYELMNTEVLAQMAVVFGTTNTASASANKDTWQMMIDEPALYVPSKFATVEEVVSFATAKMNVVKAYAVWREKRIDDFRIEKQNILEA